MATEDSNSNSGERKSTERARKAQIIVGPTTLDCYLLPDGQFAFSRSQLEQLGILSRDKTGKKHAQPLLDKDNLSRTLINVEGTNAKAKPVSLETFSAIIQTYAGLGNKQCIAFCIASLSESLESRALEAFGIAQRTVVEKNEWFLGRFEKITKQLRLDSFNTWDEMVWAAYNNKEQGCKIPRDYCRIMNELLFGVQNFRFDRDNMTLDMQDACCAFEYACAHEKLAKPWRKINDIFVDQVKQFKKICGDKYKIKHADKHEGKLGAHTLIGEHHMTRKAREKREAEEAAIRQELDDMLGS